VSHESDMAVQSSITMPKRMRYTITTPSLPDPAAGMGQPRDVDDVNSIRVYMGRGASIPTRTAMWKQNTQPADLATTITYDTLPQFSGTTNPPAATSFIASAPAKLQSSAVGADGLPKVLIDGSGFMHSETLDVSGAGATSLQGKAFDQLYYSIRTQSLLAGGGTISVSATYEVKWSARFISISRGRGANLATAGYFEILMPTLSTVITGYGGATNKTVTANGIPLSTWDALYYVLPYGSTFSTQNANFRIVNYSADFVVPNDWILICLRNGDSSAVEFTTGDNVKVNQAVGGGWVDVPITNTANFKQYNAGVHPQIRRSGNVVYFRGAISPNSAAGVTAVQSSTVDANSIFTIIPAGYRPSASAEAQQPVWVCQGSQNDRWALRVYDTGNAYAHRYGEGAASTSSWLPFAVTWLLD
jgi:hypothetical protein